MRLAAENIDDPLNISKNTVHIFYRAITSVELSTRKAGFVRSTPLVMAAGSIALLMVLSLALGPIAYASTSIPSTGTFVATFTPTQVIDEQDGSQIVFYSFTEDLTGTYSGTEEGTGKFVFHPDGTLQTPHQGTFTGTVAGKEGTATLETKCSGTTESFTCTCVTFNGEGGLVGIHAKASVEGHFTGPTTVAGTYSGQVQFSGGGETTTTTEEGIVAEEETTTPPTTDEETTTEPPTAGEETTTEGGGTDEGDGDGSATDTEN